MSVKRTYIDGLVSVMLNKCWMIKKSWNLYINSITALSEMFSNYFNCPEGTQNTKLTQKNKHNLHTKSKLPLVKSQKF